jgi:hypothetical protein
VLLGHREHLALDGSRQDRVRRLLGDRTYVPALARDVLRLDELRGQERRGPDVADLPGVHEVAERSQGLVDVGVGLGPVHLVEVDPLGLQPAQAVLDLLDDPAARVAEPVDVVSHAPVELRGQDDVVATPAQGLADDDLGLAVRVHVGGVDQVDAGVERALDDADALGVVGVAVAPEHHRAERQRADLEAGAAEGAVLTHGFSSGKGWEVAASGGRVPEDGLWTVVGHTTLQRLSDAGCSGADGGDRARALDPAAGTALRR